MVLNHALRKGTFGKEKITLNKCESLVLPDIKLANSSPVNLLLIFVKYSGALFGCSIKALKKIESSVVSMQEKALDM